METVRMNTVTFNIYFYLTEKIILLKLKTVVLKLKINHEV